VQKSDVLLMEIKSTGNFLGIELYGVCDSFRFSQEEFGNGDWSSKGEAGTT
jgi:hypothetical protein